MASFPPYIITKNTLATLLAAQFLAVLGYILLVLLLGIGIVHLTVITSQEVKIGSVGRMGYSLQGASRDIAYRTRRQAGINSGVIGRIY